MEQIERQVRADGITVPLTHNHCCGASTWASGPGYAVLRPRLRAAAAGTTASG